MNKEDFKYAYQVYKECIVDQVLLPEKLREAYYIVTGIDKEYEPVVSIRKCKQTIYNYFQYHAEAFMKEFESFLNDESDQEEEHPENSQLGTTDQTETTLDKSNESIYIKPEEQSHDENVNIEPENINEPEKQPEEDKEPETIKYTGIKEPENVNEPEHINNKQTEYINKLKSLEEELNSLEDNEDNKESRRRLKISITHLKKKING